MDRRVKKEEMLKKELLQDGYVELNSGMYCNKEKGTTFTPGMFARCEKILKLDSADELNYDYIEENNRLWMEEWLEPIKESKDVKTSSTVDCNPKAEAIDYSKFLQDSIDCSPSYACANSIQYTFVDYTAKKTKFFKNTLELENYLSALVYDEGFLDFTELLEDNEFGLFGSIGEEISIERLQSQTVVVLENE